LSLSSNSINSINTELIEAIAAELAVDASLVEKDWYAIQIIAAISKVKHSTMQLVFSGGTSLSKGYGLIQRFSEDIDFKVANAQNHKRDDFRNYRAFIIESIRQSGKNWSLSDANIKIENGSKFFKCEITYQHLFAASSALRPNIRLEVTFDQPVLPFEERSLQSFIAQAQEKEPELVAFPCVSPVETAADKLSALVWRVAARDRQSDKDDPTFVRHLHDLVALEKIINQSNQFVSLARKCLNKDAKRDKKSGTGELPDIERFQLMLEALRSDPLYENEYARFVLGMSYAKDSERPNFHQSLAVLERLVTLF
jgi:predicted nucleotidyltransferase component of viral defense system